jgi:hypothetical protein
MGIINRIIKLVGRAADAADAAVDAVANPGLNPDREDHEPPYGSVVTDPEERRANVLESLRGMGDDSPYRRVIDVSDKYRIDRGDRAFRDFRRFL